MLKSCVHTGFGHGIVVAMGLRNLSTR
jgi:hypothetical protein